MGAFIKRIQNTAHTYKLWSEGSRILVGVSGGPDSMCLLHVLVRLAPKYHWQLHLAHVNYGLRGEDSNKDEGLVKDMARTYNLPCAILRPRIEQSANLEEYLRDIRYQFFNETRMRYEFHTIAIAHTQNDQAETVLMRLLRGTGLSGLSSMKPKNGTIIRPLLFTDRKHINAYNARHSVAFRLDQSNQDPRFLRNKIRHELIPFLEERYNPSLIKTLSQTARLLSDDYTALLDHTKNTLIPTEHHAYSISFSREAFFALSDSDQKMFLRQNCSFLYGNTKGITLQHIEETIAFLNHHKTPLALMKMSHFFLNRDGDRIVLGLSDFLNVSPLSEKIHPHS
jgi:tRNA(Ile)-lysidine synthase